PSHAAKLTITRRGERFVREQPLAGPPDEVPPEIVKHLIRSLSRPVVPSLNPTMFGCPEAAISTHYSSCWTDDEPAHLIRLRFVSGRQMTIRATTQYAFMLPLEVSDSATANAFHTFDPRLSEAIAALMPEGYLERDRLAGKNGMLEWDVRT